MKTKLVALFASLLLLGTTACSSTDCASKAPCEKAPACGEKPACEKSKKCEVPVLTKDMFYKDGVFDQEAAKQAYFDMMKRMGYPISENLKANFWAIDFGLGDFPAVGMGGVFWAHENEHGVFAHDIYLLPNQFLVEHAHVAHGGLPPKHECWMAVRGTTYCFGEEGEDVANYPELVIPESQKKFVTQVSKVNPSCAKKGNVVWLNRPTAFHSQIAGPEGAIVAEFGTYHQNEGNRFTNPDVTF